MRTEFEFIENNIFDKKLILSLSPTNFIFVTNKKCGNENDY
jgi:hypothetical protein